MHRARLQRLKQEHDDFSRRLSEKEITDDKHQQIGLHQLLYYSHWYISALHILLTIPEYQDVAALPELLKKRFALSAEQIKLSLDTLKALALIEEGAGRRWRVREMSVHLPKSSPLNALQNAQWRERAQAVEAAGRASDFFYSGIYSLSRADHERLRRMVMEFLEESRRVVAPSPEEALVCLRCELFEA